MAEFVGGKKTSLLHGHMWKFYFLSLELKMEIFRSSFEDEAKSKHAEKNIHKTTQRTNCI
jgi:hypothetical protein